MATAERHRRALIVWSGMALYTLSFFLYAVDDTLASTAPDRGWMCAVEALVLPLMVLFHGPPPGGDDSQPIGWIAAFVSGCINPFFLITLGYVVRDRQEAVSTLRLVLACMILGCGVVFYTFEMYPREGFLVWVTGMLVVVSSPELSQLLRQQPK